MKILLHCDFDTSSIVEQFGMPEYSYWFVHEAYRRGLEAVAETVVVSSTNEAERIHAACVQAGEPCLLLSFNPPHKTPLKLDCPVIPVFAWEYPDLPRASDEAIWEQDPRYDWEGVFRQVPAAISLSVHSAEAVRRRLGNDYPIAAIPTPVWDAMSSIREKVLGRDHDAVRELYLDAQIVDSRAMGLNVDGHFDPEHHDGTDFTPADDDILPSNGPWHSDKWAPPAPSDVASIAPTGPRDDTESEPVSAGWFIPQFMNIRTGLGRVVYTSVLTPADGRKNIEDLVMGFVWALREAEDATLVLKVAGRDPVWHHQRLVEMLSRLSPFKCRVLVIHGYLDATQYEHLITQTDFYVNASLCEGLCMPLMEYMSCGVPAIAPDHTAMRDYVSGDNAFVIRSGDGAPMVWPYGDLEKVRTTRPRIDWDSLMQAYRDSYRMARTDRPSYAAMSQRAADSMRQYGGNASFASRIQEFLRMVAPRLTARPVVSPASAHVNPSSRPTATGADQC